MSHTNYPPLHARRAAVLLFQRRRDSFHSKPRFLSHCPAGISLSDPKALNIQITKYMRDGCVEDAHQLFEGSAHRNIVSWNSMIRGYFQNNKFNQAVLLFERMPDRDLFSYNTMIAGLMQKGDVKGAEGIFDQMPVRDIISWNSMILGYTHNSLIEEALRLFDEMPERNVISWNTIMAGLLSYGFHELAEKFFTDMPVQDVASWTAMISSLMSRGRIIEARKIFDEMPYRDVRAWNAILSGYTKNQRIEISEGLFAKMPVKDIESWIELVDGLLDYGRLADAWKYFIEMPQKNGHVWNSMLLGLIKNGFVKEAHVFFQKNPFRDIVAWTNMVIGYFEIGDVTTACKIFNMTPEKDEILWNATICGLGENDHGEEGLALFMKMKAEEYLCPDEATFTTLLNICSVLLSLEFGKQIHGHIIKAGFDCFIAVCNATITMYARCGSINLALTGFAYTSNPDIVSWNSIICGLSHHGKGREALKLFREMRFTDIKPDEVTFVGVLSACSHAGLINEGLYYFDLMKYKYFVSPTYEHYTCIVDLLGKNSLVEEAAKFIDQMRKDGIEPKSSIWGALLGACRNCRNFEIGEVAGERVLEMEPQNAGAYMILSEIYLSGGRRTDAERIWGMMKERGVKKEPGCSWIELMNRVHVFLAGDDSHADNNEVYNMLCLLITDMEFYESGLL
ncbi:pentatricopeptide repeat-containing protein At4g02750-like [Aristolochia californica]|uniref:pentatricopeptide repeat-containing protein At4g02750-like n=1 Tax=Aristolochia californica TaxID=171875 RepID=UPI0035D84636